MIDWYALCHEVRELMHAKGFDPHPSLDGRRTSVALIHSELSEALEEARVGNWRACAMELVDVIIRICHCKGGTHFARLIQLSAIVDPYHPGVSIDAPHTVGAAVDCLHDDVSAREFLRVILGCIWLFGVLQPEASIEDAIEAKMALNRNRPYKHGGKLF